MTDSAPVEAVAAFKARLSKLYDAVGKPPYRQLAGHAALDGRKLATSTTQNLLTGPTKPRWVTVEAFVAACLEHARTRRPPLNVPTELADPDQWRQYYDAIDDDPERPRATPARHPSVVPRQLPADVPGFTGRIHHLADLDTLLTGASPTVVISTVSGTAGVGKTALAVHWSHRMAGRFPDGQLYVNLRGFDSRGAVVDPADAIRGFLDALEVAPQRIPASPDAQAALYRSLLAGRRMLVLLDNARDAEQVRPLLPGTPTAHVLVTSRNQLSGLVAADGAHPVIVGLLTAAEARDLLAGRLGVQRLNREPHAADEIIGWCAGLPLALVIVAARAATHPQFPLTALAGELRQARDRLDALTYRDPATDLRAVFSWSYDALTSPAARLFRLLGLHPGRDISVTSAASLGGLSARQVRLLLAEVADAGIIVELSPGRYTLHDLLRVYAADLAHEAESEEHRHTAFHRLLDHYLHTAQAADQLLSPRRDRAALPAAQPGTTPEDLDTEGQALAWLEAERPAMLAALTQAAAGGFDAHVKQLPEHLGTLFDRRGYWRDWAATQCAALAAAQRSDDLPGQARAHRAIGQALVRLGAHDKARSHLLDALELFSAGEDPTDQARTHLVLAVLSERQSRYGDALHHAQQALAIHRAAGHRSGQADALNGVGWYHAHVGDHDQALLCCQEALALTIELGYRRGEAATRDSLGYIHHQRAEYPQAHIYYLQAIVLYQELGDRYAEATTLTRLGDNHHSAGKPSAARATWLQAHTILDDLGHPDAERLQTKLRSLCAGGGLQE